jgi:hypothetical protein
MDMRVLLDLLYCMEWKPCKLADKLNKGGPEEHKRTMEVEGQRAQMSQVVQSYSSCGVQIRTELLQLHKKHAAEIFVFFISPTPLNFTIDTSSLRAGGASGIDMPRSP